MALSQMDSKWQNLIFLPGLVSGQSARGVLLASMVDLRVEQGAGS